MGNYIDRDYVQTRLGTSQYNRLFSGMADADIDVEINTAESIADSLLATVYCNDDLPISPVPNNLKDVVLQTLVSNRRQILGTVSDVWQRSYENTMKIFSEYLDRTRKLMESDGEPVDSYNPLKVGYGSISPSKTKTINQINRYLND